MRTGDQGYGLWTRKGDIILTKDHFSYCLQKAIEIYVMDGKL